MDDPPVLSVSEVTRQLKDVVEQEFPQVWVQGEVSSCRRAGSGHIYLTLKDDRSQLSAVVWRSVANRLKFDVVDGLEVIAAGPLQVYQPRGSYQLIVQKLQPQGLGPLELAFRQLHDKLAAEGLFDADHKQTLPSFPQRIALITSPTGAAVHDLLQVIQRRWQLTDVILLPVPVQGDDAAPAIAAALEIVPHLPGIDLVITGRGGGSLEDLWAFNEEVVARAIAACPIPVMSAVGHEIDVTIADLVADRRALTPSEAGELCVPDRRDIQQLLETWQNRLTFALRARVSDARLNLERLASRRILAAPQDWLGEQSARVDELATDLHTSMSRHMERLRERLATVAVNLDALSPLKVLHRGYSITHREEDQRPIRSAEEIQPGDTVVSQLASGRIRCQVDQVLPESRQETWRVDEDETVPPSAHLADSPKNVHGDSDQLNRRLR